MARIPVISGRDAVRALAAAGFEEQKRRGKGSHIVMVRREPTTIITIPDHKELDRGTLRAIIRHAGLTVEAFLDLLDREPTLPPVQRPRAALRVSTPPR